MAIYTPKDTIDNLSIEQLEQIARSNHSLVLDFIETETIFDVERLRLIFELGVKKASEILTVTKEAP